MLIIQSITMMFYDHIFIDVYQYLVKLTRLFLSSSFSDKRYYAEFGLIDVSIVFFQTQVFFFRSLLFWVVVISPVLI